MVLLKLKLPCIWLVGVSTCWLLSPLTDSLITSLLFGTARFPGSSCVFPAPDMEIVISLGSFGWYFGGGGVAVVVGLQNHSVFAGNGDCF